MKKYSTIFDIWLNIQRDLTYIKWHKYDDTKTLEHFLLLTSEEMLYCKPVYRVFHGNCTKKGNGV